MHKYSCKWHHNSNWTIMLQKILPRVAGNSLSEKYEQDFFSSLINDNGS